MKEIIGSHFQNLFEMLSANHKVLCFGNKDGVYFHYNSKY